MSTGDVNHLQITEYMQPKITTGDVNYPAHTGDCGLKITTGDGNGPKFRYVRFPMARRWDQHAVIIIICIAPYGLTSEDHNVYNRVVSVRNTLEEIEMIFIH